MQVKNKAKIGIFDSGLGGLIIAKAIRQYLPEYDYVYLGDTKRVPYGNRSHETVLEWTREGVDYLFRKENCALVIIACNTASARALRRIQQDLTPSLQHGSEHSPLAGGEKNKKVLGVLIPAAEEAAKFKRVGVLATAGTVASRTFPKEINKLNRAKGRAGKKTKVFQNSAPMLVPLAEAGERILAQKFIEKYLKPLLNKHIDALVLGCTHYPFFKKEIKKIIGKKVKIISQDEIVPKKLKNYLVRHPEIEKKLSKRRKPTPNESKASYGARILVTDLTQNIEKLTSKWFGGKVKPKLVKI